MISYHHNQLLKQLLPPVIRQSSNLHKKLGQPIHSSLFMSAEDTLPICGLARLYLRTFYHSNNGVVIFLGTCGAISLKQDVL